MKFRGLHEIAKLEWLKPMLWLDLLLNHPLGQILTAAAGKLGQNAHTAKVLLTRRGVE